MNKNLIAGLMLMMIVSACAGAGPSPTPIPATPTAVKTATAVPSATPLQPAPPVAVRRPVPTRTPRPGVPGRRPTPPAGIFTPGAEGPANCKVTSLPLTALTDLGTGTYKGSQGGLYPGGANQPPAAYLQSGLDHAQAIKLLNQAGNSDPNGKIGLLSIGMSNATMSFTEFQAEANRDPQKNPLLVAVDGAQGAHDAERVKDIHDNYWTVLGQRISAAGLSNNQIQAVWLQEGIASETSAFPADARQLQDDLAEIVQNLDDTFPNLQIIYLSSVTYTGYATNQLLPEPYSYDGGFAVKWLIEDHINNNEQGAWLAWGPYLWTNGTKGRSDGFIWECQDVKSDGTHPSSTSGVQKIAGQLLKFFKGDQTAKSWFVK
ncbi:MAG: hypothetical protein HY259_04550 [Chloroflexi bacterium]|nr:hypothetical protein [Chloroflexota bacterium]